MLNLYTKVTPNLSGTHFYFNDFNKYLLKLSNNLFKQIDNERYDINKGYIRVKLGTDLTESNYKDVTYIINTTDNVCYHVTSQAVQSGYVIYNVNTDLWGTYIKDANLKNINIKKCNRKVSNYGTYDAVQLSKDTTFNILSTQAGYRLLFKLERKRGADEQTSVGYVGKVVEMFYTRNIDSGLLNEFLRILSNTTKLRLTIVSSQGTIDYNYSEAEVKGLWIVPADAVENDRPQHDNIYKLVYQNTSRETAVSEEIYKAKTTYIKQDKTLSFNVNKDYVIGAYNRGIKPFRKVNNTFNISFHFVTKVDGFTCIVTDGNIQEDISDALSFAYNITDNNNAQQLEKLANIINRIASLVGGVVTTGVGAVSGNALALASGLGRTTRSITGIIAQANRQDITQQKALGGGDGLSTFILGGVLGYTETTSLINEEKQARKTGANFNEYIDNLSSVFTYDLLGTGETTDDTFVIASLDVNDIPTNAVNLIETRFTSGVYLQLLQ